MEGDPAAQNRHHDDLRLIAAASAASEQTGPVPEQGAGPAFRQSAFVRDALRRQLALERLDALRQRIMPFAESRGYLTDEDVFRDVS